MKQPQVIIIGAGAAGMMCAIEAAKRGRQVLVLDQANKVGKKILMSGGGRCNFTNYYIEPDKYLSQNPHFCKSALSRYTQWDFIELVKKHRIPFHEKTLGQLFCDRKAQDIVDMLINEATKHGAIIELNTKIEAVTMRAEHQFSVRTSKGIFSCESLVIATGGLSIPTMGSSPFAYQIAEQFGIKVWPTRAGLVPLTLDTSDKERFSVLSGVAVDSLVQYQDTSFREHLLFTHRGLSGPAILQISSYWHPGHAICVNLLPTEQLYDLLKKERQEHPLKQLNTVLSQLLPKRLVDVLISESQGTCKLADLSNKALEDISATLQSWMIKPNGTEGYRTAEVTLGGVDCDAVSSKTMEAKNTKGLYFIGEALDVTGWLGGYNFQWAWSSGWAAGQAI